MMEMGFYFWGLVKQINVALIFQTNAFTSYGLFPE